MAAAKKLQQNFDSSPMVKIRAAVDEPARWTSDIPFEKLEEMPRGLGEVQLEEEDWLLTTREQQRRSTEMQKLLFPENWDRAHPLWWESSFRTQERYASDCLSLVMGCDSFICLPVTHGYPLDGRGRPAREETGQMPMSKAFW